jgi:hypothetical protein
MINKILLDLHNEPIDIYEEQKRIKDNLAQKRDIDIQSQEFKNANTDMHSLILEQHESAKSLAKKYRDLIEKRHVTIEGLNAKLLGYTQQKEQYQATLPASHKIIRSLNKLITSTKRSIEELSENTLELKQQLAKLEAHISKPQELPDGNLSRNDFYSNARDEVNRLREFAIVCTQVAADREQYNSELKQLVENYAQMVKALNDNPMEIAHETLALAFKNIVKNHAAIAEEYLLIFEELATSLPKMQCDLANIIEKQTNAFIEITQTMDETRALNAKMRDSEIVEDLLKGSVGKYMEGDLSFINYLNSKGELAIFDIEHVSKEVENRKVKDRGVNYIIDLIEQNHKIILPFKDAFKLRLLLIEYHKVVEVSTKNKKLDYAKNYLNQYASLSTKALAAGASVSPPLRNPSELKNLMQNILEQHSGADGYTRDAMLELLNNGISRLPKKSPSK